MKPIADFTEFTNEQLRFLMEMPYHRLIGEMEAELKRRFPEDFSFFDSLKVGDCFMDAQLTHMYVYKVTSVCKDFCTCTEAFINFETDDIDVYEDIDHSKESTKEFAAYTKIRESDFDQFMDAIDRMNDGIDELYVGTVCEARDIFNKYI